MAHSNRMVVISEAFANLVIEQLAQRLQGQVLLLQRRHPTEELIAK